MVAAKGKSTIHLFLKIAIPLLIVSCTSVVVQTPQQMSDFAINQVNRDIDQKTDPNLQTLAADQLACANKARLQHPIGVDEAAIMSGSIVGGALGGAASGAAGSAGTGHAGQGAAAGAVGGVGQGGLKRYEQDKTDLRNAGISTIDLLRLVSGAARPSDSRARPRSAMRQNSSRMPEV